MSADRTFRNVFNSSYGPASSTLNCDKSCEVVFANSRRRRRHAAEQALQPGLVCCRSLKILGVVIADNFSVSQHVQ